MGTLIKRLARWILREELNVLDQQFHMQCHHTRYWQREFEKANQRYEELLQEPEY